MPLLVAAVGWKNETIRMGREVRQGVCLLSGFIYLVLSPLLGLSKTLICYTGHVFSVNVTNHGGKLYGLAPKIGCDNSSRPHFR